MTQNEVLAITAGFELATGNTKFELGFENEKGELTVEVKDTNLATMGNALVALSTAQGRVDKAFCRLLADCERTSACKAFGFKRTADMAVALTGLKRDTMLIYIKVGKVFWTVEGAKKPFVDAVTVAHLAQLQGTISNEEYTAGYPMDLDFWQTFFDFTMAKYGRVIPVTKLNECLKAFRDGEYPSDLVTLDSDTNRWFLFSIYDLGEWQPPHKAENDTTADKPSNKPDKPSNEDGKGNDGKDENKPSIDTIAAFRVELKTAISELFIDLESRLSDGIKSVARVDVDAIIRYLEDAAVTTAETEAANTTTAKKGKKS